MSEEFQAEIEAGMRNAFQLGFEKGRADLLSALTLIQSIAVPLPATNVLEKSFDEGAHPRDDNGRFVSKDKISAAAKDPDKAAELRKTVTDPEQRKKLDAAIDKKGKEKVDDEEEVDNNKQAKKKGDSEKVTKIRKTATMRKTDSGSLAAAVRSSGGIDPKSLDFLKFHTGVNEAMEYGIPLSVFRKGGMGLDILAAQLHENGIINTPEGKDHAEHLLEKLAEKAKSDLADNTKEIEEAYHEHARNEYLASLEHSADEVANATRLGEEAGKVEDDPDSVTYGSGGDGELGGSGGGTLPETAGTDFDFGANEGTGSGSTGKPVKPKRRTVEQTVSALERIGKRAKLRATDLAIIHEAINGHTHAEIAEVKKRLGIKASGAKAKQAADIANRILERDRSDSRKFNHPHLTVDEAKAHVDKFVANTEPKPGDAVRLANALAGGLTTKQLLEIKKHYGIKASGAKSEMALKIAKKLAPTVANDWSEQDAKLSTDEPAKPDISSHATAYQQAKQLIATPGKAVSGVRMKQDVIGLVSKQQGVDYDTAEAMLEDHGKQPESVKADAPAPVEQPTPEPQKPKEEEYIPHPFEPNGIEAPAKAIAPGVSHEDIPLHVAINAHRNTSFVPEKRGQRRVNEYVEQMNADWQHLEAMAKTPEQKQQLHEEFERYKNGYKDKTLAYLHAGARTASPMITGGSRFPVEQNRKRMDTQQKRINELIDFRKKALKAIQKKINPATDGPILSNDPKAVEQLKEQHAARTKYHEAMKAANKLIAKHATVEKAQGDARQSKVGFKPGSSREQLLSEIEKLGIKSDEASRLLLPDFMGRIGYPSFAITNNSASIRRIQDRIDQVSKMQASPHKEESYSDGVTVTHNPEAARIQVKFPGKPERATIDELKRNGFKWSPSAGAWQRHLNNAGIYATQNTLAKLGHTKEETKPDQSPESEDTDDGIEVPEMISTIEPEDELPEVTTEPVTSVEQPNAEPKQTPKLDLFGNPIPKTWTAKKADQLSIEDQLKTAWVDHAHDFAAGLGHKVTKIHAGGQFEANGKRYRVGLADEGYPIHDDTTDEVVRAGQTSGPVTNVKPESKPVDLESKLKGIFADYLKQSSGKTLRSEGNQIAGNAPISDASRDTRDNAERLHRVATGNADESDIVSQLGGPQATKSQLATRLAKFGMPEQDIMSWIDTLKPTGKAKTGTKQNTYDTLDVAKRLGIHKPKQEVTPEEKQPSPAPVRRTMAYEGQERPEHARFDAEQTLTAEHARNPQHWDALAEAGKRDWLIQEAKRRGVGDEAKKMPARKIVNLLRKKQG